MGPDTSKGLSECISVQSKALLRRTRQGCSSKGECQPRSACHRAAEGATAVPVNSWAQILRLAFLLSVPINTVTEDKSITSVTLMISPNKSPGCSLLSVRVAVLIILGWPCGNVQELGEVALPSALGSGALPLQGLPELTLGVPGGSTLGLG